MSIEKFSYVKCHLYMLLSFQGCTCVEWAAYLDKQVGNTIHFVFGGIDEGLIILHVGLIFYKSDTYIESDKMQVVLEKLKQGMYAFQY